MNDRQTATTLAALRFWQREGHLSGGHERDIATDDGRLSALSVEEVDSLCELLNTAAHTQRLVGNASPAKPAQATRDGHSWPTVYIEAYATNEYAEGPQYAEIRTNPELVQKLRAMQALCKNGVFSEVRCLFSPDSWGPPGVEESLQLQYGELVVIAQGFWFCDQPKHVNHTVETRVQSIDDFLKALIEADGSGRIVLGDEAALSAIHELLDDRVSERADSTAG